MALLAHLGVLSETPLSFCRALSGSSGIPPGTCLSLLSESRIQLGALIGKTKRKSFRAELNRVSAHKLARTPTHTNTHTLKDVVTSCWPGSVSLNNKKDKTSWSSVRRKRC